MMDLVACGKSLCMIGFQHYKPDAVIESIRWGAEVFDGDAAAVWRCVDLQVWI